MVAKKMNLKGTLEEHCKNENVRQYIWKDIYAMAKAENLHGFEMVHQFELLPVSLGTWDLLTDTFKLKRHKAKLALKDKID